MKYSYILQDDPEEKHYNADEVITLKDFPNISMTLAEMFENVEWFIVWMIEASQQLERLLLKIYIM